jgi:hypothetical protein
LALAATAFNVALVSIYYGVGMVRQENILNRQMELDELRRLKTEVADAAGSLQSSVQSVMSDAQGSLDQLASVAGEDKPPTTDWDAIYKHRRTRERYKDRRTERARALGRKLPPKRR